MARMALRVSGFNEPQAPITLANSSVIVPLPVSSGNRCANHFPRGPFASGFRGFGSGLSKGVVVESAASSRRNGRNCFVQSRPV